MNENEKDVKIQIPAQAWLSTNIIMDVDNALKSNPEILLKEYVEKQKIKTNLWNENKEMPVYNLGTLFMMAYAFLVIPKESIEEKRIEISSPEIKNILEKMDIVLSKNKQKLEYNSNIIRHIRNSIAHVNFDIISEDDKIIFLDEYRGVKTFNGSIKINDFRAFLSSYFKAYYQSYHKNFIANGN